MAKNESAGEESRRTRRVPETPDYGTRCYRRRIVLTGGAGYADCTLEDDFHHFGSRVSHADGCVRSIEGRAVRVPWVTCPGSIASLERLVGVGLEDSYRDLLRRADPASQCTHLLDTVLLGVAHARRIVAGGGPERVYDVAFPDIREGASELELSRDGQALLAWRVESGVITAVRRGPNHLQGLSLPGRRFGAEAARGTSDDLAEAVSVLRRGWFIGVGRRYDFERVERAADFAEVVGSACFTFDPARRDEALRVHGSVRDLTEPEGELAGRPA